MSQKSKIFKIPLRFEKKTLKPARVRSLSKIVHVFVIVVIKSQVLLFQLPLKVDSTVVASRNFVLDSKILLYCRLGKTKPQNCTNPPPLTTPP